MNMDPHADHLPNVGKMVQGIGAKHVLTGEMMERLAGQDQEVALRRVRGIDARHENAVPDPTATIQGTGAKHDAGKPRAGLMVKDFARALAAISHVTTFGSVEYSPGSWRTIPNAKDRYYDAFHRHIFAAAAGEVNDPKSGYPHAAHIAWNALALLELELAQAGPDSAIRTPHSAL